MGLREFWASSEWNRVAAGTLSTGFSKISGTINVMITKGKNRVEHTHTPADE